MFGCMALLKSETGAVEQVSEASSGESVDQPAGSRGADLAVMAAAVSVLLSWYQFYYKKNKIQGVFIGLWPPTILAFASYLNQKTILDKLDQSLLGSTGGFESLRKMLVE